MPPNSTFALDRKRFATLSRSSSTRSEAVEMGRDKTNSRGILEAVAAKYVPAGASRKTRQHFFRDFGRRADHLARACSAGNEAAWEVFLTRFREPTLQCRPRHRSRRCHRTRTGGFALCRPVWDEVRRRWSPLQTGLLHGARLAGRLVANRAGAGVRQPLSQPEAPGESGRGRRGWQVSSSAAGPAATSRPTGQKPGSSHRRSSSRAPGGREIHSRFIFSRTTAPWRGSRAC